MIKTFIKLGLFLLFVFYLASCDEELNNHSNNNKKNPGETEPEINLIDEIIAKINEQEGTLNDPAFLKLEIDLSTMSNAKSNWKIILKAIETADKYVALDLSDCELETIYFFPDYTDSTGKNKIVNLILPNIATEITGGTGEANYAFKHFTNLKHISGENIIHIGNYAFYNCLNLEEVNFPKVAEINLGVFYNCVNLKEADFPEAAEIISNAFRGCKNLVSINAPKAEVIGKLAFFDCENLTEVILPKATKIYEEAFQNCKSLTEVNFPLATIIGNNAFRDCISLQKAIFHANPERTTEGHPLQPWIDANMDYDPLTFDHMNAGTWKWKDVREPVASPVTLDSIIFHSNSFDGCKSLAILNISNAWNVYFAADSFVNIGTHLNIYIFDDNGTKSYGHPQLELFFGVAPSLTEITIHTNSISEGKSQLEKDSATPCYPGLYLDIKSRFENKIKVTIQRY